MEAYTLFTPPSLFRQEYVDYVPSPPGSLSALAVEAPIILGNSMPPYVASDYVLDDPIDNSQVPHRLDVVLRDEVEQDLSNEYVLVNMGVHLNSDVEEGRLVVFTDLPLPPGVNRWHSTYHPSPPIIEEQDDDFEIVVPEPEQVLERDDDIMESEPIPNLLPEVVEDVQRLQRRRVKIFLRTPFETNNYIYYYIIFFLFLVFCVGCVLLRRTIAIFIEATVPILLVIIIGLITDGWYTRYLKYIWFHLQNVFNSNPFVYGDFLNLTTRNPMIGSFRQGPNINVEGRDLSLWNEHKYDYYKEVEIYDSIATEVIRSKLGYKVSEDLIRFMTDSIATKDGADDLNIIHNTATYAYQSVLCVRQAEHFVVIPTRGPVSLTSLKW